MTQSTLDNLLASAKTSSAINKARTLQDKYKARLEACGFRRDFNARTSKYIVMEHPRYRGKIYLGRSGAIRVGQTVATSLSQSDNASQYLHKVEFLIRSFD